MGIPVIDQIGGTWETSRGPIQQTLSQLQRQITALQGRGSFVVTGTTQLAVVTPLADGAVVSIDASLGNQFVLTALGDRTISIPINPTIGQEIVIIHLAYGANRTLSLTTTGTGAFRFGTTFAALTATTSGKTDYLRCLYNGTSMTWDVIDVIKGF